MALSAQTAVDGYVNMRLASPSAPGTVLTSTILNNGTTGAGISGWSTAGTTSGLLVGPHQGPCTLNTSIATAGVNYTPQTPSQSFELIGSDNFTRGDVGVNGTHKQMVWIGCVHAFASDLTNVADIVRVNFQGSSAHFNLWQFTINANCIRIEVDPSPTSGCVNVTAGSTYWVELLTDITNGTSKLAAFQPFPPYAQIGSTVSSSLSTDGTITDVRVGNDETGTSASSNLFIENQMYIFTGTFPVSIGTLNTPWNAVVSPLRAIDWSGAGVTGGIPTNRTQCVTAACTTAGSSSATAAQVNAAIASAPANTFVLLGSGTYNMNAQVVFNGVSNVTLRGAGADHTTLAFTGVGTSCGTGNPTSVCIRAVDGNFSGGPTNTANWTAGYTAGNTTITLSAVPNLQVGHYIILDQLDDTVFGCDVGGTLVTDSTAACTGTAPGINGPYAGNGNGGGARSTRSQQQIVKVTQCDGNSTNGHACASGANITISPALRMANWNWSPGNNLPQAWWASSPSQFDGIEDLTIDNTNTGAASNACSGAGIGVGIYNASDSWVKGVRDIDSTRAHIEVNWSPHDSIVNNYFYLTQNAGTFSGTSGGPNVTGCAYGVEVFSGSDMLLENNIFQAIASPMILSNSCSGCVLGYNFVALDFLLQSAVLSNTEGDHGSGTDFVLYEGNIGYDKLGDVIHGTHNLGSVFRNRWSGAAPCWNTSSNITTTVLAMATATFTPCTVNGGWSLYPVMLDSFTRFYNVIGNILGTTGTNTTYKSGAQTDVLALGGVHNNYPLLNDPNVATTTMLWGNCDSANGFGACRFQSSEVPSGLNAQFQQFFANPVPQNNTLPASFYYSSKPAWWPTGKAWPIIGPDVTGGNISGVSGLAYTNPAQDCYANTMGGPANGSGTVLTFSEAVCYSGATPQAATPSCSPGSGTYSSAQSVTCTDSSSGAIMCFTTNGTVPATNGTTGCTTGTLYSGAINIAVTETLQVIAGGTGFTDSSVASFAYTITTTPPAPIPIISMTGSISANAFLTVNP